MKLLSPAAVLLTAFVFSAAPVSAQKRPAATPRNTPAPPQQPDATRRADTYYDLAMGHLYQQAFEESRSSDDANLAIDFYKKAYALDPASQVIGEELATMY